VRALDRLFVASIGLGLLFAGAASYDAATTTDGQALGTIGIGIGLIWLGVGFHLTERRG
jgi:hypothetical protein